MEDKFVQYLSECDAIARAMLALADRCRNVPSLRPDDPVWGKPGLISERNALEHAAIGTRHDKGLRQSALYEAVRQWRSEHYHDYPYEVAESYCEMALEDTESPLVALFERITSWIAAEAEVVIREHILDVCRSEVPWRGHPFRQGKTCLRFSLNLFAHGRVCYGDVRGGIRAIAALIAQEIGGSVEWIESAMEVAIMGAIDDKALGKRIDVGRDTVIRAVKFYKNEHMDIWFESEEVTTQLENAIHPKTRGDHHRYATLYMKKGGGSNYEKCRTCGRVRRNRERTVAAFFQHDLARRLRGETHYTGWLNGNRASEEHRQRQDAARAERKALWAISYV